MRMRAWLFSNSYQVAFFAHIHAPGYNCGSVVIENLCTYALRTMHYLLVQTNKDIFAYI